MSLPPKNSAPKKVDESFFSSAPAVVDNSFFENDNSKKKNIGTDLNNGTDQTSPSSLASVSTSENPNVFDVLHPDNFQNFTHVITTTQGVKLNINENDIPAPYRTPDIVKSIQQRVSTGQVLPDDIEAVSKSSKISQPAINAYLTGNAQMGASIERTDDIGKTQSDIKNAVADFNTNFADKKSGENIFGTSTPSGFGQVVDQNEVLTDADKASQFLQIYRNAIQTNTDRINEDVALHGGIKKSTKTGEELTGVHRDFTDPRFDAIAKTFSTYSDLLSGHISELVAQRTDLNNDQKTVQIARLINPQGYAKAQEALNTQTGLNSISDQSSVGEMLSALFTTEKSEAQKNEVLNSVKGTAALQLNSAYKKLTLDKAAEATVTGNADLLEQAKTYAANVDDNIVQKYPALLQQQMAAELTSDFAHISGNLESDNTNTATDQYGISTFNVDNAIKDGSLNNNNNGDLGVKVFGINSQSIAELVAKKGWLNDPAKRDLALNLISNPDLIGDPSYFGSVKSNFIKPFKDLGLSIADISGFRNFKDRYSDKIQEQLTPTEVQGLTGFTKGVRGIVNTTANLAGMTAIAAATGGIGRVAGIGLDAAEAATLAEEGLSTQTGIDLAAKAASANSKLETLSNITSFGLPSVDQNLKDSYDFIDNDAARGVYAAAGAILNTFGGKLLDLPKISSVPGLSNIFGSFAKGVTEGDLTEEAGQRLLSEGKDSWVKKVVNYGKNVTEGAATMAYFTASNQILRSAFGDPNATGDNIMNATTHAFLDGLLGMTIFGAVKTIGDYNEDKNSSLKSGIYQMALTPDATKDVFTLANLPQDEFNSKMQILNTAVQHKANLDVIAAEQNIDLTPSQKAVYVANKTTESYVRKAAEDVTDETKKVQLLTIADKLRDQSSKILDGLQFNATLEPQTHLFNAKKERDEALANYTTNPTPENDKIFQDKKSVFDALQSGKPTTASDNKGAADMDEVKKLVEPYVGKNGLTGMDTEQSLKFIAEQSQNVSPTGEALKYDNEQSMRDKYGNELVDAAISLYPKDSLLKIIPAEIDENTTTVLGNVNKGKSVNENDINSAQDHLYEVLDKNPDASHLIEPIILKLQDYDNTTKTEVSTVTENKATERSTKVERNIKPALEQSEGSSATVTTADGIERPGILRIKDGNYVIEGEGSDHVIGEKAITDRDLKLPSEERAPNPIGFDKDGNVESATFETRGGDLVTIKNPDKALDIAIQLQADAVGEIPDAAFDKVYEEVQKGIAVEVPTDKSLGFKAGETQQEALSKLTRGIADLSKDQQEAEINRRAAVHAENYKSKEESNISDGNKKLPRVKDFEKMTAKAMADYLINPEKFAGAEKTIENGARIDENGKPISENDFVALKEKVKELRAAKNTDEIAKINEAPRKYLDEQKTESQSVDQQSSTESKSSSDKKNSGNGSGSEGGGKEKTVSPDAEDFTHINKEDITSAKDIAKKYPIGGNKVGWDETVSTAIDKLSKFAKKGESLTDAAERKIGRWETEIGKELEKTGKSTFNPNDEDLAVMSFYRTSINKKIADLSPELKSESDIERISALNAAAKLQDKILMVDRVLSESGTVAGRSFFIRQMIAKMDSENNLTVRRMDIMNSQGGEPLSADQESALVKIVAEENKNQKEAEGNIPKFSQEDFDKKVKEEVDRISKEKTSKKENRESTLKQSGKDLADKIRKAKTQRGDTAIDFTFGLKNIAIEAVAQLVEQGAKLADAIKTVLQDAKYKGLSEKDLTDEVFNRLDKVDTLDEIKKLADKENSDNLTLSAVGKNLVNDLVNQNIKSGLRGKEVFDAVKEDLSSIFPDISDQEIRDAYLKEGQYKLDKSATINKELKNAQAEVRSIAKLQTDISDLENEKTLRQRGEKGKRDNTDEEKELQKEKAALLKQNPELDAVKEKVRQDKIAALDKEIEDLKQRGIVRSKIAGKTDKVIDSELDAKRKELAKELNKKGITLDKNSKEEREINKQVAIAHNDRLDKLSGLISDKLKDDKLSDAEKSELKSIQNNIELAKVNSDSAQKLDQALNKASDKLQGAAIDAINHPDIFEAINSAVSDLGKDLKNASQDITLARYKKNLENKIKEANRKIEAGEFDDKPKTFVSKADAEAVRLDIEQRKIDAKYRRLKEQAENKNKKWYERTISLVQSFIVNELIGGLATAEVVLTSGVLKQPLNTITNFIFGSFAHLINPELSKRAGAEAAFDFNVEKNRYIAHYAAMGEKGLSEMFAKSEKKLNETTVKYDVAKEKFENLKEGDAGYKAANKEFINTQNAQLKALVNHQSNFLFKWIGSNAWGDASDVFLKGASQLDVLLGKEQQVGWKDMDNVEKAQMVMGMMGALHGTFKSFSARAEFAAGFTARMQNKANRGVDISDPLEILKTANESFVNYQMGKYQEDNFATSVMNRFAHVFEEVGNLPSKYSENRNPKKENVVLGKSLKAGYQARYPIIRTGVNIAREGLQEYLLGSLWGGAIHGAAQVRGIFNGIREGEPIRESIKAEIAKMPTDQVDLIFRCYRKGGLGLVLTGLAALGYVKFGGFYNNDDWQRRKGELKQGELELFGQKFDHNSYIAKVFTHTSADMGALMFANTREVYDRKFGRGKDKGDNTAAIQDAIMSDFQGAANFLPIMNDAPSALSNPSIPYGRFAAGISEYFDQDAHGDLIRRENKTHLEKFYNNIGLRKLNPIDNSKK